MAATTFKSAALAARQPKSARLLRCTAVTFGVCALLGPGAAFVACHLPGAAKKSLRASIPQPWPGYFAAPTHAMQQPACLGGLATAFAAFAAVSLWARGRVGGPRQQALRQRNSVVGLAAEGTVTATVTQDAEQEEQFKTLCTMLLRQVGDAEKIMAEDDNSDGELDFKEFQALLNKLEFNCEPHQAQALFKMLDEDGSGSIDIGELKATLRNSGVIEGIHK